MLGWKGDVCLQEMTNLQLINLAHGNTQLSVARIKMMLYMQFFNGAMTSGIGGTQARHSICDSPKLQRSNIAFLGAYQAASSTLLGPPGRHRAFCSMVVPFNVSFTCVGSALSWRDLRPTRQMVKDFCKSNLK